MTTPEETVPLPGAELTYRESAADVAELLRQAESGSLTVPEQGQVTLPAGDQTRLRWQFDVSVFDGTDQMG